MTRQSLADWILLKFGTIHLTNGRRLTGQVGLPWGLQLQGLDVEGVMDRLNGLRMALKKHLPETLGIVDVQ